MGCFLRCFAKVQRFLKQLFRTERSFALIRGVSGSFIEPLCCVIPQSRSTEADPVPQRSRYGLVVFGNVPRQILSFLRDTIGPLDFSAMIPRNSLPRWQVPQEMWL